MNTRNIFSKLKTTGIALGVTAACGLIGAIEGSVFTGLGGSLLTKKFIDTDILENMMIGAAGVGILGSLEGLGLAIAAIYGKFGITADYEKMKKENFKYVKDNGIAFTDKKDVLDYLLACFGYTVNQIMSAGSACLALKILTSEPNLLTKFATLSAGAAVTSFLVTPVVTVVTGKMLAATHKHTNTSENTDEIDYSALETGSNTPKPG